MNRTRSWILAAAIVLGSVAPAIATTISIQNADGAGEGFNDPTGVTPVAGNPGTTLGQQRLNVFQAAADYWETKLDSDVEIVVNAEFSPLTCTQFSAVLGSAGPISAQMDFAGAPVADTWHVIALSNSLTGSDATLGTEDIGATFNSELDSDPNCLGGVGWKYEIGEPTGSSLELYSVVLHEIGHGLGFLSLVSSSGEKFNGSNDAYMQFLNDKVTGLDWPGMTNSQRIASAINTSNLVWTGPKAVNESVFLSSGLNSGNPRMYAPNPRQPGSSVSHWDTALIPNELMEPSATSSNEDWLSIKAFYDMGWQGNPCLKTTLPNNQWKMIALECVPATGEDTVSDLFADDITTAFGTTWAVFSYNPATNGYTPHVLTDVLEVGKGYWIMQTTGADVVLDIPRDSHRTPVTNPPACTSSKGCFEYELDTENAIVKWNMVGNPFLNAVNLDDLRIVTNGGACSGGCTLPDAETANIVHGSVWTYDGASYTEIMSGGSIPARAGFWIATLSQANTQIPRLLIPYK